MQVYKPRDSSHCIIGMESGKDKMSCYRSPDRHPGCFLISYFPEEYDIGILAHEISACKGKVIARLLIDLCLREKAELILDRIFDGNNISLKDVYFPQCSVHGGGFTAAGRSR